MNYSNLIKIGQLV